MGIEYQEPKEVSWVEETDLVSTWPPSLRMFNADGWLDFLLIDIVLPPGKSAA